MPTYITLGAKDPSVSHGFYDALMPIIGWAIQSDFPGGWRAYSEAGRDDCFKFWVCPPFDGFEAQAGNGQMLALPARSRAEVDAFYQTAISMGGSDEGAPGIRDAYGPTWYAAYLRDPSGNKLAIVFNG